MTLESFNARLRDELLDGEIFYSLEEVRIVTGWWREHYNRACPHSSLRYRRASARDGRAALAHGLPVATGLRNADQLT